MYCSGGLEEKHKKYSDINTGRSQRGEVSCCVETQYRLVGVCQIGDGIQVYWMCEVLGELTVIQITIW